MLIKPRQLSAPIDTNLLSPRTKRLQHGGDGGYHGDRDSPNSSVQYSNVSIGNRFLLLMCASVHEEILEAQTKGHTNLYLNYRKLSELPEELLTLSQIKKLYLKRNVLKKLVRSVTHVSSEAIGVFWWISCNDCLHFCIAACRYLET